VPRQSKKKTADKHLVRITQQMWVDSMELSFELDPCIGCELCRQVCPREAITLKKWGGNITQPFIDPEECSLCGLCATFCPTNAVKLVARNSLKGTEEEVTPILDVGGVPHFSMGMKLDTSLCPEGCDECVQVCPREAMVFSEGKVHLDRSRCLSCSHCQDACPVEGAIKVTRLFEGTIAVDTDKCPVGCDMCVASCPTHCFREARTRGVYVDPRHCICCGACLVACFYGAIDLTRLRLIASQDGYSAVWSRAVDNLLSENRRSLAQNETSLKKLTKLLKDSKL
jgi:4Fe-4S ferredoxin